MGKKRGRCNRWEPCSPATAASCAVVDDGGWEVDLDDGWKTIGIDFGAVTSGQSLCFRYGVTKYEFTFLSSDEGVQENTKTGTTRAIRRVRNPKADSADTTLAQVDGPTSSSRIDSQPAASSSVQCRYSNRWPCKFYKTYRKCIVASTANGHQVRSTFGTV